MRLGELFQHNTGKALNSANRSGQLKKYITTSNLYWDRFELDSLKEMHFTEVEIDKCTVAKGDLLVCEGGDIGRAAIWPFDYTICIQNHIHRLRAFLPICTRFFYYLFDLYKHAGWIGGKGIAIQGLSSNAIHALLFPFPPLSEQYRIASTLDAVQPYTGSYVEAEARLDNLNTNFPEALKKSILQQAVQGKLVPQDPADEPASVLLERIRAEKQRLVKEGKIKKDKHESTIFRRDNSHYEIVDGVERYIDEELPFEIPESWAWCTLKNVAISELGKTLDKLKNQGEMHPYLCSINVYWNRINLATVKQARFENSELPKYLLLPGDLLVCEGGDVGRSAVWEGPQEMYYQNALHRVRFFGGISPYYFLLVLEFFKASKILDEYSKGVTIKHLVQSALNSIRFPLPPLSEQHRIVKRVQELLLICEQL